MAEINQNATAGNQALALVLKSLLTDITNLAGLRGSTTYDAGALSDGEGTITTLTVTGAALGDFAQASLSLDIVGLTLNAYVSAANTVAVRLQNESGATLDLSSLTLRARVVPQASTNPVSTTGI